MTHLSEGLVLEVALVPGSDEVPLQLPHQDALLRHLVLQPAHLHPLLPRTLVTHCVGEGVSTLLKNNFT